MVFESLDPDQARAFAEPWLDAWHGNRPELLASFYTEDAFYRDPAVPEGLTGRESILEYFRKLLGYNPEWVWTHRSSIPMAGGFVNCWHASIPVGDRTIEVDGVCTVELEGGLIRRNEVYFDRSEVLAAIEHHRAQKGSR